MADDVKVEYRNKKSKKSFALGCFLVALAILILLLLIIAAGIAARINGAIGENVFDRSSTNNGSATNASQTDCSKVANVPVQYKAWVADAASKWLGGDQAALIALIQIESGWRPDAKAPGSTAGGLGQFLASTAAGMEEFNYNSNNRFDPQMSIYATAHYLNIQEKKYPGGLGDAYEFGYHGGRTPKEKAAAHAARLRLEQVYNQILKDCVTNGTGTGNTQIHGQYASPIDPVYIHRAIDTHEKNWEHHHDYDNAVDITAPIGTSVYAFTAGKVVGVFRYGGNVYGVNPKPPGSSCGTGFSFKGDDGVEYIYCHMKQLNSNIVPGNRLQAGEAVGLSDHTGNSKSPHLHISANYLTGDELRRRIISTL